MSKSYFAYVRVSTKKQGNGASLPEQKAAITAFAQRHELKISRWFSESRTAAKAGRREFAEMVRELKRGRAAGVIIHKVDRSARNGRDWVEIGDLVDQGIEVRFAHDDLDIRTRGGRLTADIQAVIAADFIRNNREEVKKCMYGWLKQGHYPWPAPPGYLNQGKRRLKAIDPVRGPLVAAAFDLYASGNHSVETLALEMARRGLTTRNGRPLSRDGVSKMLRNPFYVGTIRIKRTGAVFEGKHDPLVTKATFDRVQALLDGKVFPRGSKPEFAFRRMIRCVACPRTLTGEVQRGHTYYRCHSRTCRGVSLSGADIEQVALSHLGLLQFDEREMEDLRDMLAERTDRDRDAEAARLAHIERDLSNIAARMDRLTDAMVDGLIDKDAFNHRKASLIEERQRLNERRQAGDPAVFWTRMAERFERANTALQNYLSATDAEKRELLISLGSNLFANGKDVDFSMESPFSDIQKWRAHINGGPAHARVRTCPQRRNALGTLMKIVTPMAGDTEEMAENMCADVVDLAA